MDSKPIDNNPAENCRLLLFDPNNGQLVFEQNISINRQTESLLKQEYGTNIRGKLSNESMSKPRFLAVRNDDIYIADLGKRKRKCSIIFNQLILFFKVVV